ncbi:NAD(P)H-hydrate dehydratase [Methanobacterium alcaliphilum]|uniref:NAD(P)H-hydrate dehydratase n=1 Tax=Methanobacterium alcaliphilum TaxID=392018 RepID=UPI00200A5783|nr:NAD(P)H-hydrate dehydratase [Methanobacterium alcaliphilum]MCK9151433.1 NAD(P)H-hydrate dehydratase [Methanobacterium alcaliphilum]
MKPLDMMVTDLNAEYLGIPKLSLMENAGRSLAKQISLISDPCKVNIFSGSGGNGGDGFVAARHLLNMGFDVEIFLLTHPSKIKSSESKSNWDILQNMVPYMSPLKINLINDSSQLKSSFLEMDDEVIVDAILGTGITGELKEPVRAAINLINKSHSIKIAVDIPSGMDPLTGQVDDVAIEADYTVTFHKPKTGLKQGSHENIGNLIVCDIGIPKEAEVFVGRGDLLRIKKRDENAHKGANGRVLVVGGSHDYTGAPALAAMASLHLGADIVIVACPESASIPIKSYSPDLIVRSFPGDYINLDMVEPIIEMSHKVDCVLIGCGVGDKPQTEEALNLLVEKLVELNKTMVLDADALKLVEKEKIKNVENLTLTPHSAEFKSFFKNQDSIILFDLHEKITAFQSVSQQIKGTVLLKGKMDMIFQGQKFRLNKTGSPGMTVGGTGDCLAGLVSALMAQGHSSFDSACLAAFINGMAGELAEREYGYQFTASEMLKFLSKATQLIF